MPAPAPPAAPRPARRRQPQHGPALLPPLLLVLLLVILPPATAFAFAFAPPPATTAGLVVRMSSTQDSSSGSAGGSDRRDALGRLGLLGGATAAAVAALGSSPLPAIAAAAAGAKTTKKALAPYPAKVTAKAYMDVRITGFVTGEEKATNEEYTGRLVVGLFGDDAPLAVNSFLNYCREPYGGEAPSYAYSAFVKSEPGYAVTAGRIKGLKEIQLAGSRQFEWFDRVLGAQGLDEPKPGLGHDRKGLLTKAREQDAVDPVFDITLGPTPERDGRASVFGIVLEGMEALDEVAAVPVYTMEAAGGPQPEALDDIFVQQKKLFLSVAKKLGDNRAVDRTGAFLKRVEILGCGVTK